MTATNHVMTGAVIGAAITMPAIALPLAFASHFLCDSLPHFEYPEDNKQKAKFFYWLAGDMALAASILISLWVLQPANVGVIVASGIVAASPDLMWLYYHIYKQSRDQDKWPKIAKFHGRIQKYQQTKYWPFELGWFIVAAWLLTRLVQV